MFKLYRINKLFSNISLSTTCKAFFVAGLVREKVFIIYLIHMAAA